MSACFCSGVRFKAAARFWIFCKAGACWAISGTGAANAAASTQVHAKNPARELRNRVIRTIPTDRVQDGCQWSGRRQIWSCGGRYAISSGPRSRRAECASAASGFRTGSQFAATPGPSSHAAGDNIGEPMKRRDFVQSAMAGALLSAAPPTGAAPVRKMAGIQVGAVSFVDEGVTKVLDIFQEAASVNTLFIATFTYGRGIAGRQVPGQPLPDHGKQEYDNGSGPGTFQGGSYTKVHPEYYKDTVLQDFRAPDFGDFDVLEAVVPAARKRGMKTICWFEDVWAGPEKVKNVAQAQEKTFAGGNANTLCFNNPNYRNWLLGTVEDYSRSYEIDGIMWGSERQGAFANALASNSAR